MNRVIIAALLLITTTLLAQDNPDKAKQAQPAQPQKPAAEKPQIAPPPKAEAQPSPATAAREDHPLAELPYTPSLDIPSMDRTADPCTDFYQYSCGGWMVNNPIPGDQAAWSVYGKLADANAKFLWGVLEADAKPRADRTDVQREIGDYFAACMNTTLIEQRGAAPLKPLLQQIDAIANKKALARFLAAEHPRTYGSGFLFGFGSTQDYGDATQVIAEAGAGGLGLPDRDYYTKTDEKSKDLREKYLKHV